ncbi:MAG: LLM class flavin-dependent oxidoreductase [Proteobacteria bacterium]|nr:LLM class flavin-dependent oxidoreductase [Pseudomonadota bacterium]
MAFEIGYLLPTREQIMSGRPETAGMLSLAERAEHLGYGGVWIGDSLTARPRHEPMAMLAAVAARVPRVKIGTAVLLPALRNPVLLAHQAATVDRISEGRLVLGVGIARDVPSIRSEFVAAGVPFEKRVGRMLEGIRVMRMLWSGEPVTWDGLWKLDNATVGPTPHRPGGPPLWIAGALPQSLERAGRYFDGWLPNEGDAATYARKWAEVCRIARDAGRDPKKLTGSMYLTLSLDDDVAKAEDRLNRYLESYYGAPAAALRKRQECFAGPPSAVGEYLGGFAKAGANHVIVRFVGDQVAQLEAVARARRGLPG